MTAALTSDPGAALDRLQLSYASSLYSDKPDEREISMACAQIIKDMVGEESTSILSHPNRSLHIVTARGKGILASEQKLLKGLGFAYTFTANALSRKFVQSVTDRVLFTKGNELPYIIEQDILRTKQTSLNADNLILALRASGSIPFVMEGISDIPSAPKGTYWDGGLTDYHIALPYEKGIILQPHFFPFVLPGWLDKKIPWNRRAKRKLMSKVLLICPSESFVQSLPRKQISDMKDFNYFGTDQQKRIDYWNNISERSLELGVELKRLIETGEIKNVVRPYSRKPVYV